jgi:hypothetical protein
LFAPNWTASFTQKNNAAAAALFPHSTLTPLVEAN